MKNHAYGVTGVRRVNIGSGINAVLKREKLALVRMALTWDKGGMPIIKMEI